MSYHYFHYGSELFMKKPDFKTILTLPEGFGKNYGAARFRFKAALFFYTLVTVFLFLESMSYSNFFFAVAAVALLISRMQYKKQHSEKLLASHEETITKIIKTAFASTGKAILPHQVNTLWSEKMVWADDCFFVLKSGEEKGSLELNYSKLEPEKEDK